MANFLKPFEYDINLNPEQVLGRIKSKTVFSNRIIGTNDEFEGEFYGNKFKIHFILLGNIFVQNSNNPHFYGEALPVENHTKLKIKMRPDVGGYGFLFFSVLFFLAAVFMLVVHILSLHTDVLLDYGFNSVPLSIIIAFL